MGQPDPLVENAGCFIETAHALEFDPAPRRCRRLVDGRHELARAAPQGHEVDPLLVEFAEIGVRRESGIENELLRHVPGARLPELDEAQDLVGLRLFAELPVRVAEDPGAGILGEKGENAFLPA